ncbi:MAG: leucine-rich repeat protein [Clostridia bacterium]|nr:leucine-rich repeat protein [Clostridia bacterium]
MKKALSLIISLVIVMTSCTFIIDYVSAETSDILEFPCGLNATAYLDRTSGTLTVKGTGEMNFFYDDIPWWAYRKEIYSVVVEEGITKIAECAFLDCDITKIILPASLETIDADALSMTDIEEIIIPENSRLCSFPVSSYFRNDVWYQSQPDGPVYLGNLLLEYKGTMPANTTITVKDGTYAINRYAFNNQKNMVDVAVPDSVERIGYNAFYGTSWMDSQPYYKPVYLGKVLYFYNFPWRAVEDNDITDELVIPEGIVSISSSAFSGHCTFRNIVLPESLEHIGYQAFAKCFRLEKITVPQNSRLNHIEDAAFYNCNHLEDFDFPEGFKRIGINTFLSCKAFKNINMPASVENIGLTAFEPNTLESFTVDSDNPYYCTDENGILYNKDKTTVYGSYQIITDEEIVLPDTVTKIGAQAFVSSPVKKFVLPESVTEIAFEAFGESNIESINIPYGVKRINDYAFHYCVSLKEIEIPKSVEFIDSMAFDSCHNLQKTVIPAEVKYIAGDAFTDCDALVIYCYKDTTAYYYATENDIPYVILEHPDMAELNALLDEYEELNRDKYFEESLVSLDEAVSNVDMTITVITQEMVDNWVSDIVKAKEQLKYLPADYSEIEAAKARAELVDRSLYTVESLAALDKAVAAVDETLNVSNQDLVNEYAKAINDAIDNLEYLPANYDKIKAAIAESEKLDRILYSQATLEILDQSIAAIDYTLNITQQSIVDGFADRINSAISALEYADVVLRNEPGGVIVSATAKEIYPTTVLTVDMLDPSNYETANFAVGGYIKSVKYYNINLIRDGAKVQPDGTVSVKIKIPDDVTPEKCRVYHVTEDPVDPLVRFASTLDGNYIVFETDHFSEFAVIEVETYLSGISITKAPSKLTYALNEKLDLSDMQVTALMSDGKSQIITDYDVSNVDMSSVGTKTVTVYYTYNEITKSASFEITVSADKIAANITLDGKDINEYNKKVKWYKGYSSESLQLECSLPDSENYNIKWNSDNSKVFLDDNGKVTNKGFFFPRKATVTVTVTDSAGNVLATDSVIVRFYKFSFQLSGIQTVFQSLKRNGIFFF